MKAHGIFVGKIFMDKKERKVSIYVGDEISYEATMTSKEVLEDIRTHLGDVVVRLRRLYPEVITQWNSIAEHVHELLKHFLN